MHSHNQPTQVKDTTVRERERGNFELFRTSESRVLTTIRDIQNGNRMKFMQETYVGRKVSP